MRVAVAGKGGAGKTTISGTIARILARRGRRVVAIDGDGNPNLSLTLGLPTDEFDGGRPIPHAILEARRRNGEIVETLAAPIEEILASFSTPAPDGISLITMSRPESAGGGCLCTSHGTIRGLIGLVPRDYSVVLDLEASPEHLTRGTPRHVDWMLFVTEPTFKSIQTTERYYSLAQDLGLPNLGVVANKVDDSTLPLISEFCEDNEYELLAEIPDDPALREAESAAVAPIDHAANSVSVRAIESLVAQIEERLIAIQTATA